MNKNEFALPDPETSGGGTTLSLCRVPVTTVIVVDRRASSTLPIFTSVQYDVSQRYRSISNLELEEPVHSIV